MRSEQLERFVELAGSFTRGGWAHARRESIGRRGCPSVLRPSLRGLGNLADAGGRQEGGDAREELPVLPYGSDAQEGVVQAGQAERPRQVLDERYADAQSEGDRHPEAQRLSGRQGTEVIYCVSSFSNACAIAAT